MRTIEADARRYAWCRGHALWIMGMPAATFVEDIQGALAAEQYGLLHYAARAIGDCCAVVLNLALNFDRPIPPPSMRDSVAIDRLEDETLRTECWELIRGTEQEPPEAVAARCQQLVERVRNVVGDIPPILSPEGYFPALALARDWLQLMAAVGEQGFLPSDWTRAT
jgi:hypothetical protein